MSPQTNIDQVPANQPLGFYQTQKGLLLPGVAGQARAGRLLTLADFTALGLNAPAGLYNLDSLNDSSGNGRTLNNTTAAVAFTGTNHVGSANSAAVFTNNNAMGLFLADGNGGPFNPRTISVGCWFICQKRGGVSQRLLSKGPNVAGSRSWVLAVNSAGPIQLQTSGDLTTQQILTAFTDCQDARWHFVVGTFDGNVIRVYVDGNLDGELTSGLGPLAQSTQPFNIGSGGISAAAGTGSENLPMDGRIASAFVTPEVINEDQVRNLYAALVPHGAPSTPDEVVVSVRRRRRGSSLASSNFTAAPVSGSAPRRLYTHAALSLTDLGADAANLTATGSPIAIAGVDGKAQGAVCLPSGVFYTASVPTAFSGTNTRSCGCWFVVPGTTTNRTMMVLGGGSATDMRPIFMGTDGTLQSYDGTTNLTTAALKFRLDDFRWHFAVAVWDNSAADGIKRKLYVDGKLAAHDTNFASTTTTGGSLYIGRRGTTTSEDLNAYIANSFVCDYALTPEQIQSLYSIGSFALGPSPFPVGDVIETMDATNLYVIADLLDPQHLIDFKARIL